VGAAVLAVFVWAAADRASNKVTEVESAAPHPNSLGRTEAGLAEPAALAVAEPGEAEAEADLNTNAESASDPLAEWVRPKFEDWKTIGPRSRTPLPYWYFDPKYPKSMTWEELDEAFDERFMAYHKLAWSLAKKRESEGLYDLVKSPPLDANLKPPDNWMGVESDYPQYSLTGGYGVPAGLTRITWLPFDQNPELYEIWDETQYLIYRKGLAPQTALPQ
jgi:hypothetical protein